MHQDSLYQRRLSLFARMMFRHMCMILSKHQQLSLPHNPAPSRQPGLKLQVAHKCRTSKASSSCAAACIARQQATDRVQHHPHCLLYLLLRGHRHHHLTDDGSSGRTTPVATLIPLPGSEEAKARVRETGSHLRHPALTPASKEGTQHVQVRAHRDAMENHLPLTSKIVRSKQHDITQ